MLFAVASQGTAVAQEPWSSWVAVSGGMGISAVSAPSVVDYVNTASQAVSAERVSEFSSTTEFIAAPEIRVAEQWAIGLDYSYRIKSLVVNGAGSQSQFEISSHQLGFVIHYLIEGESYLVRLGGGGGPVLGSRMEYQDRGDWGHQVRRPLLWNYRGRHAVGVWPGVS